jgi:membrane fusion protein (multidrug efflux system)
MKSRVLVLSVFTLLPLTGCKENSEKLTQLPAAETATQQTEVVSVAVVPVKRQNVSRSVLATGTSEPVRDANLSPQMTGRIASIHVKEGDKVKAGAVLAQLDSIEAALRVEQSSANAASTRSQYELAKAEYDRLAPLAEKGTVTAQQLQRLAGQRDALKSAADAAQVGEANAKHLVTTASIRAPFSGVVSKVQSEVGEVATLMPVTVIVRLVDLSSVDVRVPVHERELSRIAIGNRVVATFPSIGASAEGKVTFISPEIDPKTRSAEVVTRIPNPAGTFRAGMFTEISIDPSGTQESLVVPKSAVGGTGDNRYVFVAHGDTVEQRKVRVSAVDADTIEVLEGLKLDEPVVLEGIGRLSDGTRVKLEERAERRPAEPAPAAPEAQPEATKADEKKAELTRGTKP